MTPDRDDENAVPPVGDRTARTPRDEGSEERRPGHGDTPHGDQS